jgi:hypothetical protein
VLAFAFVHGELDGVAVGAMKRGVFVEDALNPVIAGGEIEEIGDGVAEGIAGDEGVLAGGKGVDISPENLLGLDFDFKNLGARLGIVFCGDDDVDAAVERSGAEFRIERDSEARLIVAYSGTLLLSGVEGGGCRKGHQRNETDRGEDRKFANEVAGDAMKIL